MDLTYAAGLDNNVELLGVAHPFISSTPSTDYVIPGSGQLVHLFPSFVPIYSRNSSTIEKKVAPQLDGHGNESSSVEEPSSDADLLNSEPEPSTSKGQKRSLSPGILDSFLHPKLLKTDTIKLEAKPTVTKSVTKSVAPQNKSKSVKNSVAPQNKSGGHRFKFFD